MCVILTMGGVTALATSIEWMFVAAMASRVFYATLVTRMILNMREAAKQERTPRAHSSFWDKKHWRKGSASTGRVPGNAQTSTLCTTMEA